MTMMAIVLVVVVVISTFAQACIPMGSSSGGCNCAQNSGCQPCVPPPPPPPVCNDCASRNFPSAANSGCGRPQCAYADASYVAPMSAPILPLPPPPPPPIYSPPPINLTPPPPQYPIPHYLDYSSSSQQYSHQQDQQIHAEISSLGSSDSNPSNNYIYNQSSPNHNKLGQTHRMMAKDKAMLKQSEQSVNYVDQRPSLNTASTATTSNSNEYSSEQRELDGLQGQEFVQQGYQAKETSTEETSTYTSGPSEPTSRSIMPSLTTMAEPYPPPPKAVAWAMNNNPGSSTISSRSTTTIPVTSSNKSSSQSNGSSNRAPPSIAPTTQEQVASSPWGHEESSTSSASPYKQYLDEGIRMEELDAGGLYMIYSDQVCTGVTLGRSLEHSNAMAAAEKCALIGCAAVNLRPMTIATDQKQVQPRMEAIFLKNVDFRRSTHGYKCISMAGVPKHNVLDRTVEEKEEITSTAKPSVRRSPILNYRPARFRLVTVEPKRSFL